MKKAMPPGAGEKPIDWLLTFLQRDLTTLRAGERLDLSEDMNRLLLLRDPAVDLESVDPPDGYAFALAKLKGGVADDLSWPDALVLEVQAKLKAGVAHLEAGRTWKPFDKALTPVFVVDADKTVTRRYRGSYEGIMLAASIDLLVASWPQLRRCAYAPCSILFRPTENRQHYHDPKCSKLERWHRLKPKPTRNYVREEENAAYREQLKKKKKAKNKPSRKGKAS